MYPVKPGQRMIFIGEHKEGSNWYWRFKPFDQGVKVGQKSKEIVDGKVKLTLVLDASSKNGAFFSLGFK